MARKLSRVASCVLFVVAFAAIAPSAGFAQSVVRVSPAGPPVVNPFAAKRTAAAPAETAPPVTVAPIESAGPKAFQNPFARQDRAPRFVTPRLQAGPMSRWHRTDQTSPPPADERPIQAVETSIGLTSGKGDLSGPLARTERRTALFTLPGSEEPIDLANPPDPSKFVHKQLQQPAWLLPHEMQATTASDEATDSFTQERAVAQASTIDPFEDASVAEIVVSDDPPVTMERKQDEPIAQQRIVEPQTEQGEEIVGPELQLPAANEAVDAAPNVLEPVVKQLSPPPKRGADQWYAEAERAAARATSTIDMAAVVELCQRGIECRPDAELGSSLRGLAAWACNRSGEIESDQRREDEALKAFELAIQWDPNCWLALHNRAVSRAQQGNLEGALSDFNRSLQLNPGLAVAFRNRGELLAATGRTEEAIADYSRALAQLPQDADLLSMRGEAYHRLGEYEKAIADLTQAIELAPQDNAVALAQRGNVRAELGDFGPAINDFQQALAIDANSAEVHRSLAWLLATCPDQTYRNAKQALSAAEKAAALATPGDPFVLDALAAANANAGQFDRAARIQQEAIVNVPQDFAGPFRERLAMYEQRQPFRNGSTERVDENVRAASLEAAPRASDASLPRR